MSITDNQYINRVNHYKNTINHTHDLKANFDKILMINNQALSDRLDTHGNLQVYLR